MELYREFPGCFFTPCRQRMEEKQMLRGDKERQMEHGFGVAGLNGMQNASDKF